MAEWETSGGGDSPHGPDFDPPRGDEGLDDWFARRLEAQGIVASRPGFPTARILAVLGLVAAVAAFGWVILGAGGSSSSGTTSTPTSQTTHKTTGTGPTGGKKQHGGAVNWRAVKLTVLNGYGVTGAASTAQAELRAQGWNVVAAANAGVTSVQETFVVYAPGMRAEARVVAKRLQLPAPKPIAQAEGVQPASTDGVAIVLGANGIPALTLA